MLLIIKRWIPILMGVVSLNVIQAQDAERNLEKYWSYRNRFNSHFIVNGTGRGEGLAFSSLGFKEYNQKLGITMGDATLHQGWYIGVLATEWKLLHDQGLSTADTELDLFYALEAYNRLDYYANVLVAGEPDVGYGTIAGRDYLDGYIMREDPPDDFLFEVDASGNPITTANNLKIFNARYSKLNHPNRIKHSGCSTGGAEVPYITYCSSCHNESGQLQYETSSGIRNILHPDNIAGLDQITGIFLGLTLAKKYLPSTLNAIGHEFSDGLFNFHDEIRAINTRIIKKLLRDDFWIAHVNTSQGILREGRGGNCRYLSFPLYKISENIGFNEFIYITTFSSICLSLSEGIWNLGNVQDTPSAIAILANLGILSYGMIAASHTEPIIITLFSLFPPDNIFSSAILTAWCDDKNYGPLYTTLYKLINPNRPNLFSNHGREDMLNSAPCDGPGFANDSSLNTNCVFTTVGWACGNKFTGTVDEQNEGNKFFPGLYPGIDYMLLFNLYCLYNPNYLSQYTNKAWMNLNENVPLSTPYHGQTGSSNNFLEYNAFDYIQTSQFLNQDAHLSYQAGREIIFLPGFESSYGSEMLAHIESLECESDGHYRHMQNNTGQSNSPAGDALQATYPRPLMMISDSSSSNGYASLSLFPNPTTSDAILQSIGYDELQISVSDLSGKILYQTHRYLPLSESSNTVIPSSEWANGVYIISCTSKDAQTQFLKLMKGSE